MVRDANDIISIFMNINGNYRNERKFVEKLRCVITKLPISHLLCVPVYQALYQISA